MTADRASSDRDSDRGRTDAVVEAVDTAIDEVDEFGKDLGDAVPAGLADGFDSVDEPDAAHHELADTVAGGTPTGVEISMIPSGDQESGEVAVAAAVAVDNPGSPAGGSLPISALTVSLAAVSTVREPEGETAGPRVPPVAPAGVVPGDAPTYALPNTAWWDDAVTGFTKVVTVVRDTVRNVVFTVTNGVRSLSTMIIGTAISALPGGSLLQLAVEALVGAKATTPTSRLYASLRALTATDHDGIVLKAIRGSDGQDRLAVFIGGTVPFSATNQPAVDNLVGWNRQVKNSQWSQIVSALNGNLSKPIMLVGFSQGGMDAQNLGAVLKAQGYNVQAVVAFGSPEVRTPGSGYQTILLSDHLDPVTKLRQAEVSLARDQRFATATTSDLYPGIGGLNVHARVTTYVQVGRQFDSAFGYREVKAVIRSFEDPNAGQMPVMTEWVGTWTSFGQSHPAVLLLVGLDPISGAITVGGGQCMANWSEVQRYSDTERLVHADVTQGNCIDNHWRVTTSGRTMSGVDASGRPGSFSVTRR